MSTTRREFLSRSALLALGACHRAPALVQTSGREVLTVLPGVPTTDGAGVKLTRVIGQPGLRHLDPFILLDRLHSDDPGAYLAGFPNHPHRGFETVSVMLDGHMRHQDSRGNHGLIVGGGAQWMTAGRGIVHSEMPEQEQGRMSGFLLWVNLPAAEKLCPQFYQDLQPGQLVQGDLESGGRVRLISGRHDGLVGPVRPRATAPLLATLALEDDRPFTLEVPAGHQAFAFVSAGEVELGPEPRPVRVGEGLLALLGPGTRLRVRSPGQRSLVLIAAGKPIGEPIVQRGPFVMNTEAEIQRAFADYQAGVLDV